MGLENGKSGPVPDKTVATDRLAEKGEPSFEESMQRLKAAARIFANGAIRAVMAQKQRGALTPAS